MFDKMLELFIFILPAYIANATPVLLGGGMPMDFRKKFPDGKRILGDGKTWRGFFSGLFSGTITGFLLNSPMLGFLLSLGTMAGDTAGSFLKRRMGMERGKSSLLMDQLLFLLFALLFAYQFIPKDFGLLDITFLIILTYLLHVFSNMFAHRMGWKKVPW